jgi:RNA polymerase sigma factor (sigma-70 family)
MKARIFTESPGSRIRRPKVPEQALIGDSGTDKDTKDADLLRRFALARDEHAFGVLVRRHSGLVYGICRRFLADPHDAEDAFQATFLVLACKAGNIRKMDSLASWLFGVATRVAGKMRARAAQRRQREQRIMWKAKQSLAVSDNVSWRDTCRALHEEMSRLPDKYRIPLLLCYWEGQSQEEAARQLGWPRGTLKRRIEDGRERLRQRLARRGLVLSALLLAYTLGTGKALAANAPLIRSTIELGMRAVGVTAVLGGISPTAAFVACEVLRSGIRHKIIGALACLGAGGCLLILSAGPLGRAGERGDHGGRMQPGAATSAESPDSSSLPGAIPTSPRVQPGPSAPKIVPPSAMGDRNVLPGDLPWQSPPPPPPQQRGIM